MILEKSSMKFSTLIGILASLVLIAGCYAPWAYYPDIDQTFTGFYSAQNYYGHPGKALVVLSILCMLCFIIPRIWAKRVNLLLTVITFSFGIKSYLLFTSCYRGTCPEK